MNPDMFKRVWWWVLGAGVLGIILGALIMRGKPVADRPVPGAGLSTAGTTDRSVSQELPREKQERDEVRESNRHATDEVRKNRLPGLEKAVATQEQIVAEKRKALSDVIRTQGVEYKASDPPKPVVLTAEQIEQLRKRGNPYVDGKRDLEREMAVLESMKQKLIEEKKSAEAGDP